MIIMTISLKSSDQKLAKRTINAAGKVSSYFERPLEGWIRAFQFAIGLRVVDLATRLGISSNSVYVAIKNERSGRITLNQLSKVAEAMGGKLVYAIIPKDGNVERMLLEQARKKATKIIRRSDALMALDDQTEKWPKPEELIEELAHEIVEEMPRNFWD